MTAFISSQKSTLELQFPIMLRTMTDEETKEYHRMKLFELSLKSIGQIAQVSKPNIEQKKWIKNKMSGPAWTWEVWDA